MPEADQSYSHEELSLQKIEITGEKITTHMGRQCQVAERNR